MMDPKRRPPSPEIILRPSRGPHGTTYWQAEKPAKELTLAKALLEFFMALFSFVLRLVWYLIKWGLVVAFYAALFGFFLLLFAVLFSL